MLVGVTANAGPSDLSGDCNWLSAHPITDQHFHKGVQKQNRKKNSDEDETRRSSVTEK